jgi:hypothetical protein
LFLVGWWLVGWLVGCCLVGRLVGWLVVGWLGWLVGPSVGRLVGPYVPTMKFCEISLRGKLVTWQLLRDWGLE